MRIKKILSFALLISLLVNAIPVLAKEGYYTNRNGLELTFDEYRLALEHIDECTLEVINREQYEYILSHSSCVQKENIYIKTIIDRKDGDVISEHLLSEEEIIDELNCQNISLAQCGGRVASTQHCQKDISLFASQRYDIQASGMGGVFQFNPSVGKYYDNTPGLMVVGSIN